MKFSWVIPPENPLFTSRLCRELSVSPLLAQCLNNRGFSEPAHAETFLQPRLKNLCDPFNVPGMSVAVDRLFAALHNREPVLIFGDYDVDGVTSTTLLMEVFEHFGWKVQAFLPHRMADGYGLTQVALEKCLAQNAVKLVLAVDCGSTAVQPIAWLRGQGIDVIVLDHHQASSPVPDANVLVNPWAVASVNSEAQQNPSTLQPFQELCSVGLAFKMAHALVKRGRELGTSGAAEYDLRPLLDLVCLGTIADLVPLVGESRILAAAGLARLDVTSRPGLQALKCVAQCATPVSCYDAGFLLGPRLNAAGRLETAQTALRLLRARSQEEAVELARQLDACNKERQEIEKKIADEAVESIRARFAPERDFVIVEGRMPWHIGVVGIVASRVLQQFHRPTIIVGGDETEWRGSGRSIAGFDLAAALRECSDLLTRHGGHAMAAGLAIAPAKIDLLRERLNSIARQMLSPECFQPRLRLDAEVKLKEMGLEQMRALDQLKPCGCGNAAVQLYASSLSHARPLQRLGRERQHVKMWVTDGSAVLEALWWKAGNESLPVGRFDLAFAPQINRYNGNESVQLKVLDWRPAP